MLVKASRQTCLHEAAHVAASHFFGWPVRSVSVVPDADTHGRVTASFHDNLAVRLSALENPSPTWRVSVQTAIRLLSGPAAEVDGFDVQGDWLARQPPIGDVARVQAIGVGLFSDPGQRAWFVRTMGGWTSEVILECWPGIRSLASALELRPELSGAAALRVLDLAMPGIGGMGLRDGRWMRRLRWG